MRSISADATLSARPPATAGLYQRRTVGLILLLVVLALAILASLAHGSNPLSYSEVWTAVWSSASSEARSIVTTERWPRTLVGVAVGAPIGVAGALMQAITRNPLADPGLLGVNAGAGFAVTLGVGVFGLSGINGYIWFAFVGAALTTFAVYLIGTAGRGVAGPITLVLAGVALGAVLSGFSRFLTLIDEETFRSIRNWDLGSLSRTTAADLLQVAPFLAVGVVGALALAGSLNSMALGDDLAASLGTRVVATRLIGIVLVTLLAGGATALTGGIAFVGLMVPHIVRWFVGPDQRWIITCSAAAAPALVLIADVLGRVIGAPGEVEVGIMTAVVGAPVLIFLVRRRTASGL